MDTAPENRSQQISANLQKVREQIATAAKRAGRNPDEIILIAVSKFVGVEEIRAAYRAGQRVFGESRIQECHEKVRLLTEELPDICFTMIGHLQSNKVKKAIELFSEIQSVDSLKIAQEISRRAREVGKTIDILLELNSSGEAAKYGAPPENALHTAQKISELPNLNLNGIMTIGPLTEDENQIREAFKQTHQIHNNIVTANAYNEASGKTPKVSMGMSGDFEIAIEEGSDMIRVGTAIFGPRTY